MTREPQHEARTPAAPDALRGIHVRTGGSEVDERIASWFAQHQVQCLNCNDVFDAGVLAARGHTRPVQLIFVGTDWLLNEDLVIFEYLLRGFPEAVVIAHGESADVLDHAAARPHVIRNSASGLTALLEAPVADLLARRRSAEADGVRDWRPSGLPKARERSATDVVPRAAPPAAPHAVDAGRLAAAPTEARERAARKAGLLSDEELSALLGDDDA